MVPTVNAPESHHFLGPILWSPDVATPPWWDDLDPGRPVVYVNLGSSGPAGLLPSVLDGLADLPVTVIAATLGRPLPRPAPANARTADYLPGEAATARSRLVVCNGGSPTTHQALAGGVPVLGIASNMDQHLNMASIQGRGAGEILRSDSVSPGAVRAIAAKILDNPSYAATRPAGSPRSSPATTRPRNSGRSSRGFPQGGRSAIGPGDTDLCPDQPGP